MALRGKLFRFLSANTLLTPSSVGSPDSSLLIPSVSAEVNTPVSPLKKFSTTCARAHATSSYNGLYALALPRGVVHVFNLALVSSDLQLSDDTATIIPTHAFAAHDSTVISVSVASSLAPRLVTLGTDDQGHSVKIWHWQPSEQRLHCAAVFRLQTDSIPTTLTIPRLHPTVELHQIAVGFDDGSLVFLHGDLLAERASRVRIGPAPGEMIEPKPIVFAQFVGDVVYCVSEMSVVVIVPVKNDDNKNSPSFRREILDNLGVSDHRLCCVLQSTEELVVAKKEALYFFNKEGRGPCIARRTDTEGSIIAGAGNYVIHVTDNLISAYDFGNKLIAYRGRGGIRFVFNGRKDGVENVLIVATDGSVLKLSEISLQDRVNMLLKRGLYTAAISLAKLDSSKTHREKERNIMLIKALRQYSEFLMSKDRYDEAAEQLIETIKGGQVEPSWVITRLVEQSGLRSGLRLYLEALHAEGKAAFVHTKVLITCYRHDRARGAILGSEATEKTTDEYVINVFSDVDWSEEQVDAAIVLCRDAGLFKVAERVSRRRGRYVQLAKTLVEDLSDTERALDLLRSLPDEEASKVILAVGRQLLVSDPMNFVNYLANALSRSASTMPVDASEPILKLHKFLPIFIDAPRWRAVLLEKLVNTPNGITAADTPRAWILLFESLVCIDVSDRLRGRRGSVKTNLSRRLSSSDSGSPPDLPPGLLLPHLQEPEGISDPRERRFVGRRALKVLQSRRSVIDLRAALEIAEQYGHDPCLEYLYEHLRMYKELGISLRMAENGSSLLRACRRHGDREAYLWIEAIRHFAPLAAREDSISTTDSETADGSANNTPSGKEKVGSESSDDTGILTNLTNDSTSERETAQDVLEEAMTALDRSGTLSPLEIVDIVTEACPNAPWGLVREFFERSTSGLRRDAAATEHTSHQLDVEVRELRKEAKRLVEDIEKIRRKSCAACEDKLSLPSIHFLCGHSYHAACLSPGGMPSTASDFVSGSLSNSAVDDKTGMWGEECPRCAPELDAMVSMRQALQEKNEKHDEFFGALRSARDGFSTIIEFLERSPFI